MDLTKRTYLDTSSAHRDCSLNRWVGTVPLKLLREMSRALHPHNKHKHKHNTIAKSRSVHSWGTCHSLSPDWERGWVVVVYSMDKGCNQE